MGGESDNKIQDLKKHIEVMCPIFERKWEETFATSKFSCNMFYRVHNSHDNVLRFVWRTMEVFTLLECHGLKGIVWTHLGSMNYGKMGRIDKWQHRVGKRVMLIPRDRA
jgi:hypothetical protein